ncbi:MAG: hypothetical protein FWE68_03730 [Defluviitaleaceae bacterium]|nr:hypothetical protein [Defluviitaleaceae bacterium]
MDPFTIGNVNAAYGAQYSIRPESVPAGRTADPAEGVGAAGTGQAGGILGMTNVECVTCAERTYQDRSDDPGVSMQTPTNLSPEEAAGAVMAHEREHQVREAAKAEEEGREVLSNEIQIFTSVCPECGKTYVSGGKTTTVTRAQEEAGELVKQFFDQVLGGARGEEVDARV